MTRTGRQPAALREWWAGWHAADADICSCGSSYAESRYLYASMALNFSRGYLARLRRSRIEIEETD